MKARLPSEGVMTDVSPAALPIARHSSRRRRARGCSPSWMCIAPAFKSAFARRTGAEVPAAAANVQHPRYHAELVASHGLRDDAPGELSQRRVEDRARRGVAPLVREERVSVSGLEGRPPGADSVLELAPRRERLASAVQRDIAHRVGSPRCQ